jgi:riboflavin biosynthesis pyrimidine reductase
MKRLLVLILIWTLLVLTGTLVSADGRTIQHNGGKVWLTTKNTQEEAEW